MPQVNPFAPFSLAMPNVQTGLGRTCFRSPRLAALSLGLSLGLSLLAPALSRAQVEPLALPSSLTALTSDRGMAWLQQSEAKADYIPLSSHFVTQDSGAYCGIASLAMVLNAMELEAPLADPWQLPYFTQVNVLNAKTAAIIPTAVIQRQGLTLQELAGIGESHGVRVRRFHGEEVDVDQMRAALVENLASPGDLCW
ncbi:MAG: phytochelatin synthase family protein [Prochlorothrix sp.]